MPDLAMCENKECPINRACFRFMAKPNEHRQAYGDFQYDGSGCDYFASIDGIPAYRLKEIENHD